VSSLIPPFSPNYPRPDYLSSSRKRLAPQLIFKGGIINAWGKKTAVALLAAKVLALVFTNIQKLITNACFHFAKGCGGIF